MDLAGAESYRTQDCQASDTRWMVHERSVKDFKASYGAIVTALDDIHEILMNQKHLALAKLSASCLRLMPCTCLTMFFFRWPN